MGFLYLKYHMSFYTKRYSILIAHSSLLSHICEDFDFCVYVCSALKVSIVSQEPVLFNCSIEDNIAYGFDGKVSSSEIENVAVSF